MVVRMIAMVMYSTEQSTHLTSWVVAMQSALERLEQLHLDCVE